MKCEVLISTMNCVNYQGLLKKMNLKNSLTVINQITDEKKYEKINLNSNGRKILSFYEKGLSKSRNKAIKNSDKDTEICIIADDDMYYEKDYANTIIDAYKKYPDADLIAFVVDNENKSKRKKIQKEGKISYLKTMKIQSVQVTFKKKSIVDNNICFDELFGAGSKYYWGEENIFLFDCLKKGLKIYYVPQKIATLYNDTDSSWNKDNTCEHYQIQGAIYYRMSKILYLLLIVQFVLRKRKIYCNDMTSYEVLSSMILGVKKYKRGIL